MNRTGAVILSLFAASLARADAFNWIVNSDTSILTTTISATLGSTISDTETNKVSGFIGGELALPASTFGTIHLTTADLSYTTNPSFSLTRPIVGGVNIVGNGLGFAIPGPNNLGFASPSPASVGLDGAFSQTGNGAEGSGTLAYTGVGLLGSSIGSGTINLVDQSPLPMDWNGTITQSGNQLLITLPISVDQTSVQNGIPVRVQITGNVFASASTRAGGWKVDADGLWSNAANWSSNSVPTAQTSIDTAVFGAVITQPRTVSFPVSPGIKRVIIDSPVAYQFPGGIRLWPNDASIEVRRGTGHTIQTLSGGSSRVTVASESVLHVNAVNADAAFITKSGPGRLEIDSGYSGAMSIEAGSVVLGTELRVRNLLAVSPSATLDIRSAKFQLDYESGPVAALASIRALIIRGYAGGAWNGDGISSSILTPGGTLAIGYGDTEDLLINTWGGQPAATAVLAAVTLQGDANLDFAVNFDDLLRLAQHYGGTGVWSDGDFNYDGLVNFDDLLGLAQQYGSALSLEQQSQLSRSLMQDFALARSLVPEPMMAFAMPILLHRRRRN